MRPRPRTRRLLHLAALGLGYPLAVGLALLVIVLALRWLQVSLFYTPAEPERSQQKATYLASLPRAAQRAPNFVVVFFDDLGWGDLSSYGNRLIRTPRIDALAAEGVRMTDFYAAAPVCTPSRAALLTGRYPSRTLAGRHVFFSEASPLATMRRMLGWGNELVRDEILLPEVLAAAGYETGMIGKWHLGGIPGHMPNDFGFDFWYGVLWSNDMMPLHLYRNGEIEERDERQSLNWNRAFRDATTDRGDGLDQRTLTERYTREAIGFLEANRDRPFFLYLAHTAPHVPHFASKAQAGQSAGGTYGDVVEDLDRSVGMLSDALDRLGLADDTLLIVTSDNGADYNGSPGFLRGRKGETYEGGQRVPMIARWPGRIPAGRVSSEMAMTIDLFPTFLGLAELPLPSDREIDGRDLLPVLERGAATPHRVLFYLSAFDGEVEAVRGPRFKYRAESGDLGRSRAQLWRMDADSEAHDLTSLFPDEAARLARELGDWKRASKANPRGWR